MLTRARIHPATDRLVRAAIEGPRIARSGGVSSSASMHADPGSRPRHVVAVAPQPVGEQHQTGQGRRRRRAGRGAARSRSRGGTAARRARSRCHGLASLWVPGGACRPGGPGSACAIVRALNHPVPRSHGRSHAAAPGPVPRAVADRRPLSSRHAERRIRSGGSPDPDRRRRPEPARPPGGPAPVGRLRDPDGTGRRRGAPAAPERLAGPADHRHDDAADGRPDPRPRDQGPGGPADHRPVRDRRRRLQGRPARGGRRGLRHEALPLPGAAGPDQSASSAGSATRCRARASSSGRT